MGTFLKTSVSELLVNYLIVVYIDCLSSDNKIKTALQAHTGKPIYLLLIHDFSHSLMLEEKRGCLSFDFFGLAFSKSFCIVHKPRDCVVCCGSCWVSYSLCVIGDFEIQ